jgi:hypothetical protein
MYITIFNMTSITKITRMIAKNWFERLGPKKGAVCFEGLTGTELVLASEITGGVPLLASEAAQY